MDESAATSYTAAVFSLVGVSGLCVALRLLARRRKGTPLWWDDLLMVVSWLCLVVGAVSIQLSVANGLGHHVADIRMEHLEIILFYGTVIAPAVTIAASVASKISFALTLLRICSTGCTEKIKRVIWGVIISLLALLLVAIVMLLATCSPIEKNWRPYIEGHCLGQASSLHGALIVAGLLAPSCFLPTLSR